MQVTTFTEAVSAAEQSWLQGLSGDPNTVDVLNVAEHLAGIPNLTLRADEPPDQVGVELVECVEAILIRGNTLIRNLNHEDLVARVSRVADEVLHRQFFKGLSEETPGGDPAKASALALYTWHGCLCMAKSCRLVDSAGRYYSPELRQRSHQTLTQQMDNARYEGRRWIRYGMRLARPFEEHRGNTLRDSWVPKGSPYWGAGQPRV